MDPGRLSSTATAVPNELAGHRRHGVDAGRGSGWAKKLAPRTHARVNKVETRCARVGRAPTSAGDDGEMHTLLVAVVVDPENGVKAREVQKTHAVEIDDEERDAVQVDLVDAVIT